jgi:hypothetical protein
LLGYSRKPAIGADAVVMEYLPHPSSNENGWTTLFDLSVANAALVHNKKELILEKLKAILLVLKNSNLVHGDLRSNNLMVYGTRFNIVEPVQLKAIDMEWAGKQGEVCYPDNRNLQVGYPGEAGKYIGLGDDAQMVEMWAALVYFQFCFVLYVAPSHATLRFLMSSCIVILLLMPEPSGYSDGISPSCVGFNLMVGMCFSNVE